MPASGTPPGPLRVLVLADAPAALGRLCGITLLERLLRTLQRAGLRRATLLTATPGPLAAALARRSWASAGVEVAVHVRPQGALDAKHLLDAWPAGEERALVVTAAAVLDGRLVAALAGGAAGTVLVDAAPEERWSALTAAAPTSSRGRLCGAALLERSWIEERRGALDAALAGGLAEGSLEALDVGELPAYVQSMRRELRPFWFPAPAPELAGLGERRLLDATQKRALDFPAYVHAPIETLAVRLLCRTPVTPNQVSIFGNLVAWTATALLFTGRLGAGVALALAVGVLDGIDGKLARAKVETTALGKLEHWFDKFFEISWAVAVPWHLATARGVTAAWGWLALLLGCEAIDGLAKLAVLRRHRRQIDDLSRFDRAVRLFAGRRNVYVWTVALGILAGRPAEAFAACALIEAASAAIHAVRAAQVCRRVH